MGTKSLHTDSVGSRYASAMQEVASLRLATLQNKEDQVDLAAFTLGQSLGGDFLALMASSAENKSEYSAKQAEVFAALSRQGPLPYRTASFRSVFLGQGKRYSEDNVFRAIASGARLSSALIKNTVAPAVKRLHAMHAKLAVRRLDEVREAYHRVKSFRRLGEPSKALDLCHSILSSKDFTKMMVEIEGQERKSFYFSLLSEGIETSIEAGDALNAASWLTMRMQKGHWQKLSPAEQEADFSVAGSVLSELGRDQNRLIVEKGKGERTPDLRKEVFGAAETAKSLWNEVVSQGLFSGSCTNAQSACIAAKNEWRDLDLDQLSISAPHDWKNVGDVEFEQAKTLFGLNVVLDSDWRLEDFEPLDERLSSFYQSIVRHAQNSTEQASFLHWSVLAGAPGALKTSFGGALAAAVHQKLRQTGSRRKFVCLRWHDDYGCESVYSGTAGRIVKTLKKLEAHARREKATILILADEMEIFFADDNSQGSVGIENRRANQSWYSWLDSSRKDSNLFFFFTMNDTSRLPRPIQDRLGPMTVFWPKPPPYALRNLLRRSQLNFSLRKIEATLTDDCMMFGPFQPLTDQLTASYGAQHSANASDAILNTRPDLPARDLKIALNLAEERSNQASGEQKEGLWLDAWKNLVFAAPASNDIISKPSSHFLFDWNGAFLLRFTNKSVAPKAMAGHKEVVRSCFSDENFLAVFSSGSEDLILRVLSRNPANVDDVFVSYAIGLSNDDEFLASHEAAFPLEGNERGAEITIKKMYPALQGLAGCRRYFTISVSVADEPRIPWKEGELERLAESDRRRR